MRGLHLLFCPAPGGHQPPSGGSPPSPAPSRRPRCRRASCLPGSSPWARCLGRSSTLGGSHRSNEAATQRPTAGAAGREERRPKVDGDVAAKSGGAAVAAALLGGRLPGHLALLPAEIPSKTATSLSCQSCHSPLHKRPEHTLVTNHTYPADRIKGSTQVI